MFGAICGDILGSAGEFEAIKYEDLQAVPLCRAEDRFTDDTAMTLAVADWLLHDIADVYEDDEALKHRLATRFVDYALHRFAGHPLGLGGRFRSWCCKVELIGDDAPIHSYGNGAGMRVSPVGFFFDTMEETMRFAKLSADVTHDHPEGQRGAMCIAAAVFLARKGHSKAEIRRYLREQFRYPQLDRTAAELRMACEWSEICQDTVPMSVVAFLESSSYEEAVRIALSYGSDSDTIGDMAGAIAEAYYGAVPQELAAFCTERLPEGIRALCREFYAAIRRTERLPF